MKNEVTLMTVLPKALRQELEEMAKENNLSLQELIIQLLNEVLSLAGQQHAQEENESPDS